MEQKNTVDNIREKVNDLLTKHLGFEENSLPAINDYALEYIHGLLTELVRLNNLKKSNDKSVFQLTHQSNVTMPDGAVSNQHIMFKLLLNENVETIAWVKDGENKLYGYEFLIEFDVQDFGYGIYYGCKTIIPDNANVADRINFIKEDWDDIRKAELVKVLTHIFKGISFEKKLIPTTNANNNTFWPFWIRLNEYEDIIEVAAMATLFIARFCLAKIPTDCQLKDLPKTTDLKLDELFSKKEKKPIYYFTEQRREEITKNDKNIKVAQKTLDTAIEALVKGGVLTPKPEYEYAWQFNKEYKIPVMKTNSQGESGIVIHQITINKKASQLLIKTFWDIFIDLKSEENPEKINSINLLDKLRLRLTTSSNKKEEEIKGKKKKTRNNKYPLKQIWVMWDGNMCNDPENSCREDNIKAFTTENLKYLITDLEKNAIENLEKSVTENVKEDMKAFKEIVTKAWQDMKVTLAQNKK